MSRRYGRNQRRRARERIAELEQDHAAQTQSQAMDRALLASACERNRALAAIINLVREELPNHPLLPVDRRPEYDFSSMEQEIQRGYPARVPLRSLAPTFVGHSSAASMDTDLLYAEMAVLVADTDFSTMRGQVHMTVRLGREAVAYAISTQALMTMDPGRLESLLTREIARALACLLVAQWQTPGRDRGRA